MKIRDELIDDLECISGCYVDRGFEVNRRSLIIDDCIMNPMLLIHILNKSIPVLLSIVVQ